jgi:hypothetical protein
MPRNPTSLRCMRVRSTASPPSLSYLEDRNGAVGELPIAAEGCQAEWSQRGFFVADLRYQQGLNSCAALA